MKKLLSLLIAFMFTLFTWATTVDLSYPGGTTTNMTGENDAELVGLNASEWSVIADKGAASYFPGLNKDGDIRLYWNAEGANTITVSSLTGATINNIEITFTGGNYANAYVEVDGTTVTPTDGIYTIDSEQFVIGNANTSNVQVRIKKITIDYTPVGVAVNAPQISGTTPFANSTEITMMCTTADAIIYYTLDGSEPTDNSTQYSEPVILRNTTTVKAIAYKGQDHSSVVSKEFVKIRGVNDIAEMNALDDNTQFVMNNDVVCIWRNGAYMYVQDATAATLIYNATFPAGVEYAITDVIPAGWQGVKTKYNELPEIINATEFTAPTSNLNIEATVLDIPNIDVEDFAKYVVVKNVLITATTTGGGDEPPVGETIDDVLNNANTIAEETTRYTDWTTTGTSGAVYAGQSAGSNGTIQLRSNNNNSGIVTTTSGGTIRKITVNWNSSTSNGRTINIYGSDTPFTNPTDLYGSSTTPIATIVAGASTQANITANDYAYVGIRSASGALYLDDITFSWEANTTNAPALRAQTVTGQYTLTDLDGNTLTAYPAKLGYMEVPDDLDQYYDVYGVLDFHNNNPQILPIGFMDGNGVITAVEDVNITKIKSIKYYNVAGIVSDEPFDGINIVKIEYMSGDTKTYKTIK